MSKKINDLKKKIASKEKAVTRLMKVIDKKKEALDKKIDKHGKQSISMAEIISNGWSLVSKKAKRLCRLINEWPEEIKKLNEERDALVNEKKTEEENVKNMKVELSMLLEEERRDNRVNDATIAHIFTLRDELVVIYRGMEKFLNENIYNLLIDEETGDLRSQITLDNSDGTRRVVAMVNSIFKIDHDMATEAITYIDSFFDRVNPSVVMDDAMQAMYDLTRKLLVEKSSFQVGPDLYRFLGLDLNAERFPELVEAQNLLKKSLRSEKSNSYIKLFKRAKKSDKWESVGLNR